MPQLPEDADNGLSLRSRELPPELYEELKTLQVNIDRLTERIERPVLQDAEGRRLQKVPGVGTITASALLAAVGDALQFRNGRPMAAFLSLTVEVTRRRR